MFMILHMIFSILSAWAQISADFGGVNGGAIRFGDDAVTVCSTLVAGTVKFDSATKTLRYCDATDWKLLVPDPCSTSRPTDWSLTNLTGQNRSTVVTSSIDQVTGLGSCIVPISVAGTGATAEYRICDDASCTSVSQNWGSTSSTIANNKYVQVRITTSAVGNVTHQVNLSVGFLLKTWSATTAGNCGDASPATGTFCADGTVYVGLSPDGNTKMYTTPCHSGRTWDGTACVGNFSNYQWSNKGTISNGISNNITGEANTTTLAGLTNADDPYPAAEYCDSLNAFGQTDWYLPSLNEVAVIQAACDRMPEASCTDSGNRQWTSRESSALNAFHFFYNGSTGASTKNNGGYRIRCVRKD